MRKLFATMAVSVFALWTARGISIALTGPAEFKLNAITQSEPFQETGSKSNATATVTNITSIFKSASMTKDFANSNLLALLANSFNTNFPAGSQIGMTSIGAILVVDKTGTNLVFNPISVVSISYEENFSTIMETEIETDNQSGFSLSGNDTQSLVGSVTIAYDDTAQTTGDTTHTKFQLKGLLVQKSTENLKTRISKTTTTFQGTGGGPVRGVGTILTGSITVKAQGFIPPV